MTTTSARTTPARGLPPATVPPPHRSLARNVVGVLFVFTSGIHLGIVATDPEAYRHFADGALFPFVRDSWDQIVMSAPGVWGLLLMAGELVLGLLLLVGGRAARLGWYGVIVFHVLLMSFGFGVWLWSVPALVLLITLARRDGMVDTAS